MRIPAGTVTSALANGSPAASTSRKSSAAPLPMSALSESELSCRVKVMVDDTCRGVPVEGRAAVTVTRVVPPASAKVCWSPLATESVSTVKANETSLSSMVREAGLTVKSVDVTPATEPTILMVSLPSETLSSMMSNVRAAVALLLPAGMTRGKAVVSVSL